MSYQEFESQSDISLHEHINKPDSSPTYACDTPEFSEQTHVGNSSEPGNDETIPEPFNAPVSGPNMPHTDNESQVDGTQCVAIELETQPTAGFSISPNTRRVLENTDSGPINVPHLTMSTLFLERQDSPFSPNISSFRFGTPPKQNSMRHGKPLPGLDNSGLNQKIATECAPITVIRSLPSRGVSPKHLFTFERTVDSAQPATQNGPASLSDRATPHINHTSEINSRMHYTRTSEAPSVTPNGSGEPKLCMLSANRPPSENTTAPLNSNMHTRLMETSKARSIVGYDTRSDKQPKMNAKARTPPFAEATIRNEIANKVTEVPAVVAVPGCAELTERGLHDPKPSEIQRAQANNSELRLVVEAHDDKAIQENLISVNSHNHQSIAAQELPDARAHDGVDSTDMMQQTLFEKIDLHQSRLPPGSISLNNGQMPRTKNGDAHAPKQETKKFPSGRPQPQHQLQLQDIRQNQSLHSIRDSRVSKKGSSKAKATYTTQSNDHIPNGVSGTITSAEMLHMATVMATAEKEQRKAEMARAQLQEVQIRELSKDKAALQDQIEHLEKENGRLVQTYTKFQRRCEKYQDHMNDVIRAQKELGAIAKGLEKRKFDFVRESARQMDTELSKIKESLSEKSREILKEARQKIDGQEQLITLLKQDLNNRLLELQRERGLTERLQKQLEDREEQQNQLRSIILKQHQDTATILAGHGDAIGNVLVAGADRGTRLDECLSLIKTINESELNSVPALNELTRLVVTLSTSVERKLQDTEDSSNSVREASLQVLAQLQKRLDTLIESHTTRLNLTASIVELREENAILKERIRNREAEFTSVENQLKDFKLELQKCRSQLTTATDDLRSALTVPREDPVLRVQLHDLQTSYSALKDQAEFSTKEVERVRADLRAREESHLLTQQEVGKLQEDLRQSEAKVSTFGAQKEAYVRQLRDESEKLRIQMERDVRARLAEDEAHHNGVVSGLRRQILEAEAKLVRIQKELHDMERMGACNLSAANELGEEVSALKTCIDMQSTSLGCFQEKLLKVEQHRDLTTKELYISREQLVRCETEATEWRAKAEANALLFEKRCKETDECIKKSEQVADAEVNRLKARVTELEKKNDELKSLEDNVDRHFRKMGLLKPGITLMEWMELSCEMSQQETDFPPQHHLAVRKLFHGIHPSSQESCPSSIHADGCMSAISSKNPAQVTLPRCESSTELVTGCISSTAAISYALPSEDTKGMVSGDNDFLPRNEEATSDIASSINRMICGTSNDELNAKVGSLEYAGLPIAPVDQHYTFPAVEAVPHSYFRENHPIDKSTVQPGCVSKLSGINRTVIPNSQEEFAQTQIQNCKRPTRRVAQRQNSIFVPPEIENDKRTGIRTGASDFSIRTPSTLEGMVTAQCDATGTVLLRESFINMKTTDSDIDTSSPLSDPLSDLEFMEFLEDHIKEDQKSASQTSSQKRDADGGASHSVLSPKSNTSRVRTASSVEAAYPGRMKPPKSILKRTKANVQTNDITTNSYSNGEVTGDSHPLKVQYIHASTATNNRLSRPTIGSKGLDCARYNSPYNRVVSGTKASQKGNNFQSDIPNKVPATPMTDNSDVASSSPAIGQPQRNSKKRVLSGVGIEDSHRSAKVQRLGRH